MSEKAGSHLPNQKKLIEEMARVTKKGAEIFIGYLSPKHSYMQWTKPLGGGYYKITVSHADPTLHGIIIFVQEKVALKELWDKFFDVEIKFIEHDLHRCFSSFYYIKGKRK